MLSESTSFDHGAYRVDDAVDLLLRHGDAVLVTSGAAVRVDLENLALLERFVGMPCFTILRVRSMVRARVGQVLVVVGAHAAGVPAVLRLFVSTLRWRLVRAEVADACGRCSSLARWRILARGLADGAADDE